MLYMYTKYESSGPCSFRQEYFWKLHFKNLFFDPVTYLCNKSEPFEQFLMGATQGPFLLSLVKIPLGVQEKMAFEVFLIEFNVKFWSQGHNLNNFDWGPLDDAINQICKLWTF